MPQEAEAPGVHEEQADPVWLHSKREGRWILLISAAFLLWTVGYCYLYGYGSAADTSIVFGLPGWIAWGIALPWVIATTMSIVFALVVMRDDPLGEDAAQDTCEDSHADH